MKIVLSFLILFFTFSVSAIEAPKGMTEFNKLCPFKKVFPSLDKNYHECSNGYVNGSCKAFISDLTKLLPIYDCQRSFDKNYIVPAIWLAGAATEDYYSLLYTIVSSNKDPFIGKWFEPVKFKAKTLFLSSEFKATLDGHMAEEYYPLIKELKNKNP